MTEEVCDAIQAASTEELTRRREYIAGLEAALKPFAEHYAKIPGWMKETLVVHPRAAVTGPTGEKRELLLVNVAAFREAEAALSGSTAALDAVVADAVAKVTEERDAAERNLSAEKDIRLKYQDIAYATCLELEKRTGLRHMQANVQEIKDGFGLFDKAIESRDSRLKAEGRREGLEEAAALVSQIQLVRPHIVKELSKLAAQAGEAR